MIRTLIAMFGLKRLSIAAFAGAVMSTMSGAAMAQDAENGESVFRQCRACHKVGDGAKSTAVGPHLNGIVGRKAATAEGFRYSAANTEAAGKGLVWTEEKLLKYLENPRGFMPGTRMSYAGLKDEGRRRDLIAYLKTFK